MPDLAARDSRPDDQYYVNVHNDFVLARMDWSIMMHRIMMVLISRIDSRNDQEFKRQYMYVSDLMEMSGAGASSQYDYAKKAVERLVREPIEFETPDGSYVGMPLFNDIRYLKHKGLISARFHREAEPYLLQLEKQFTSWRLEQTIPLTTSYAVRHYMIGKMVERRGRTNSHTFEMDDYRTKMAVEDKYDRFVDLRRRVIDPSMEQVNNETDVQADYDVVRSGQSPVGLRFDVRPPKTGPKPKQRFVPAEPDVEPHDAWVTNQKPSNQKAIMKEAEERAKANGYDPDQHWQWRAGVDRFLRRIYKERASEAG